MSSAAVLSSRPDVTAAPLFSDREFPLVIRPIDSRLDLVAWATAHQAEIDQLVSEHGALLFRGFPLKEPDTFARFVDAACPAAWMEPRQGSTLRTRVQPNVFISESDPRLRLYVHNENAYLTSWPLYIFFHCRTPAAQGGHTPLADSRAVYRRLPSQIVERFADLSWLYRRNFQRGSTVTWQKAFAASSPEDVERYCHENYMIPEWTSCGLTVRFRRWAALRHPRTQQMVWFNHGTVFNPYTIDPSIRDLMLKMGEDRLPYCTYYGDGSPIEQEVMRTLDEAYTAETISFPWEAGDVLMVDNMSIAHGRTPYMGHREVFIAMKREISCSDAADYHQYELPA